MNMQSGGRVLFFFLPYFLLRCPNSFTKVSLCERKWRVSRWSAAVNHLDVLNINVCLLCSASACVFKDLNLKVKIIRAFCACIENQRSYCCLFMPVISVFFALKGAWGIKKGGSTSLNSLLHTPLQEMMESSRGRRSCLVFRQRNAAGIDNGPSTSAGLHAPQRDIHQVPCPPTKTQRHQHPHHTGQLINTWQQERSFSCS